ncbi:Acg family FMN-binding oxidoreductase [Pseudonocardia sp. CA-142604]|uniref:Acg family FMN-binding oxidoreductase n=1 Tax=Pseudonocardia sp. CA-142604 TaxID=3240024 RepID=UPI003D8C7757
MRPCSPAQRLAERRAEQEVGRSGLGAIEDALRAPSVYNTQPWRWRIRPGEVELHADWDRHLVAADPDRRDLLLSCGAALHHFQVALAARGISFDVVRLPDPENSGHVATVDIGPPEPDAADRSLYSGIARRRTDCRQMSRRAVPTDHLRILANHTSRCGAVLVPVTGETMRRRMLNALVETANEKHQQFGYASEWRQWTHRYPGSHDGIPAANIVRSAPAPSAPFLMHRCTDGSLPRPPIVPGSGSGDDAAELVEVATRGDDALDRLQAGEATSAVLLAATQLGLATTPFSQAVELHSSPQRLRRDVLRIPEYPQLLIRVGWPASGATELPATPRRSLCSVFCVDPIDIGAVDIGAVEPGAGK